jgi:signal transduction histidine kinase
VAKSDFLATVSHELRTPVSVILGYTDLLLDGTIDAVAEQNHTLRRVRQQATQILDTLQGLLDVNRIEGGGTSCVVDTFQAHELMTELRESLPAAWYKPGVDLDWRIPDTPVQMHSDRGKVQTILRNLVHNALKHTHSGAVTVATTAPGPGWVCFTVADTGEGMAQEELSTIFEMFGQGRNASHGDGVGLGLYIVKRLTETLGGHVDVESELNAGTSFRIMLPLDISPPPSAVQQVVRT